MNQAGVQLVCFDLGGVLLRICRSWAEGCAAAGLELRDGRDLLHRPSDGWNELNDLYQRGRLSRDEYARRFSDATGGLYSPEEIIRVHEAWILGEYEGVGDVIRRIGEAGLDTAVLSNTTHEHWLTLPRYPSLQLLKNRLASHELGLRKPEEASYRAVEQHTGQAGASILFFDDLEENILGARAAGWRAERIDPFRPTAEQMMTALHEHGVLA
ncbi:MAG: HAD-IA family hydrolase [Planctomycetota bacterium]|nr:HAD-IA family hydrolase [Planctomycetota bacterium]